MLVFLATTVCCYRVVCLLMVHDYNVYIFRWCLILIESELILILFYYFIYPAQHIPVTLITNS